MTTLKKIDQGHYAATVNGIEYRVFRNLNEPLHSAIAWVLARDGEWIAEGATFGAMKARFDRAAARRRSPRAEMPEDVRDQLDYPWNEPGAPFQNGDY